MPKNLRPLTDINAREWYSAREAGEFLGIVDATVKRRCREGTFRGRQIGPKKTWHLQGEEVLRIAGEWGLDSGQS